MNSYFCDNPCCPRHVLVDDNEREFREIESFSFNIHRSIIYTRSMYISFSRHEDQAEEIKKSWFCNICIGAINTVN